jgi:hypothetical protein
VLYCSCYRDSVCTVNAPVRPLRRLQRSRNCTGRTREEQAASVVSGGRERKLLTRGSN